jgi:membrane-bound metal-dependent hydrolase YbcI (DUF457 family)
MPLTPLHLGPTLFIWVIFQNFFNLWAAILGSTIMDLEPLVLVLLHRCYSCPHHGFFHSILGAILGSLILAVILWILRKKLNQISLKFHIFQDFTFYNLYFSSLFFWLIHIFSDSLTHKDVFLFWPSKSNPFFISKKLYWPISIIFFLFLIFSFSIYVSKSWFKGKRNVKI